MKTLLLVQKQIVIEDKEEAYIETTVLVITTVL